MRAELQLWQSDKKIKLVKLSQISRILRGALWSDSTDLSGRLASQIILSKHALEIRDNIADLSAIFKCRQSIAFLKSFYHFDLFIDIEETPIDNILVIVNNAIKDKTLTFPSRFGRSLYDKFNLYFAKSRADHLSSVDTARLVGEAPQGVYQVGNYLIGPLGLFVTDQARYAPPSTKIPLWHCSDLGCNHLHSVSLTDHNVDLRRALNAIDAYANATLGPAAHWHLAISSVEEDMYDSRYGNLLVTIQDCLSQAEKCALLNALLIINDTKNTIRKK